MFNGLKIVPKVKVKNRKDLAVVYTPGVAKACEKIAENVENSFIYTNRANSVGVLAFEYSEALKRAIFLKSSLNIDAYPLQIDTKDFSEIKTVVENIEPTFNAFDLSLIKDYVTGEICVNVPVLTDPVSSLKEFFKCTSKTAMIESIDAFEGDAGESSLAIRKAFGGSLETALSEQNKKFVAIITDGSAVLGLGNIGAYAALPVMEGKAVLFSEFGGVSAMPLCVKTTDTEEFVKIVKLLINSFSAINLEDVSAPSCFEKERLLRESGNIATFHDDAHGTSIVVTAAIINAFKVVGKRKEDVKIVISGAGAAGTSVAKLLLKYGVKNLIACDRRGAITKQGKYSKPNHKELAKITNPHNEKGKLKDVLKNADVFIGLSAPKLLTSEDIKNMAKDAIVFSLANPVPEIMPDDAKAGGARIVGSGRSDFENQINNCLAFPGVFAGILKYGVKTVTDEMKLESAKALAASISHPTEKVVIPDIFDKSATENVMKSMRNKEM